MWWRKRDKEEELRRELQDHLDLEAADQAGRGSGPHDAANAARRALGNRLMVEEDVRRQWAGNAAGIVFGELRLAFRNILRAPGFALTVVLTLALGIAASTAVFSIVDSVLLKPLTYRDSQQLVAAWEHIDFLLGADPLGPNPRHVDVWSQRSTAFDGFTVFGQGVAGLGTTDSHPRMAGIVSSATNLFDVLGTRPALGRLFLPQDGVEGKQNVAVLTHATWQTVFNGDPAVIGKSIRLDEQPREIIGVLPANFHFPSPNSLRSLPSRQPRSGPPEPAVFLPFVLNYANMSWNGNYANSVTIGRLKPGHSIAEATAQLNAISGQIETEHFPRRKNGSNRSIRVSLQPMQEAITGGSSASLWMLMAAVLGLMLIACLNLANAQLGRGLARARDAALRTALGAGKRRLVFNSLAENLVLSAIGGTLGVAGAALILHLCKTYSAVDLPRLSEVEINPTVLLFAAALTITASLLSGLIPALKLLSLDPQQFLQQGGHRAFGSRSGSRLRLVLIGAQVLGCTALLLITGLFAASLRNLLQQDTGFRTQNVAIAELKLPRKIYGDEASRLKLYDAVVDNLRAIPGVESAAYISATPLEGESWIEPLNRADRPGADGILVNARWTGTGYFESTGQTLVAGRFFEERDRTMETAVLSAGAAKALWGTANPIGQQVSLLGRKHTVIGVAGDSRSTSLKTPAVKMAYVHYAFRTPPSASFVLRGRAGAGDLTGAMRAAIWQTAPAVTLASVKTFEAQLADSVARERFQATVLIAFGAAALLLAMLGIYGVLSYAVAARRQEIGVRMALGASRGGIYALTFAQIGPPVVAGIVLGLLASLAAGRLIRQFLYGVEPFDPAVALLVTVLFLAAAAAAAFLPARRAASVDPIETLRAE